MVVQEAVNFLVIGSSPVQCATFPLDFYPLMLYNGLYNAMKPEPKETLEQRLKLISQEGMPDFFGGLKYTCDWSEKKGAITKLLAWLPTRRFYSIYTLIDAVYYTDSSNRYTLYKKYEIKSNQES